MMPGFCQIRTENRGHASDRDTGIGNQCEPDRKQRLSAGMKTSKLPLASAEGLQANEELARKRADCRTHLDGHHQPHISPN